MLCVHLCPRWALFIYFEKNCEEVYEKDDCAAFEPFCCSNRVSGAAVVTEKLDLEAAKNFAVDRLEGGYSLITVQNGGRFLLIPAGMDAPNGLDADIMPLYMPLDNLFVASTSTVALMDEIGALSAVTQTTYDVEDWYLPSVKQAVQDGQIAYIGYYKQPDFERIALNPPKLAVFSTMIEGTPDVREKLDELGIPLLVDSSALEETPLGRMEWMKLYGVLLGRENEASTAFDAQKQKIESLEPMQENVTVAMFYITSKGALYVRNNGDYMVKMLELLGGGMRRKDWGTGESGTRRWDRKPFISWRAMQTASSIWVSSGGKPKTLSQLIERNTLLADFKAVQNGRVYCTGADYFQQAGRLGDLIEDMNRMLSGDDAALNHIMKLE